MSAMVPLVRRSSRLRSAAAAIPDRPRAARAVRRFWLASGLLFWQLTCAPTSTHALGPKDRRLTSARAGISVEAPQGWTLSQHTGYTDTVVLLIHPDGSRISVTAAMTTARDADALFEQNRPGLTAQGLVPTPLGSGARQTLAVDLVGAGRPDKMRQLYLVRDVPGGRQAIVLTLVSNIKSFAARAPALDLVAIRLTLDDPLAPSGTTRPLGSADTAGTTGNTANVTGGAGGAPGEPRH